MNKLVEQVKAKRPEIASNIVWDSQEENKVKLTCTICLIIFLMIILTLIFSFSNFITLFIKLDSNMKELKNTFFYTCFDDEKFDEVKVENKLIDLIDWIRQGVHVGDPEFFTKRFHETERSVKCFCLDLEAKDQTPVSPLLQERCSEFKIERTVYKIPWLFPNVILILSNFFLEYALVYLADFIPFKLESSRRSFKCFALFLLFSFNYFFIYFIYQNEKVIQMLTKIKYFRFHEQQQQLLSKQFIFELHGDYIQLSMVFEILRGLLNFFVNGGTQIWRMFFSKRRFGIRRKVLKHLIPPQFEIEGRIALMFTLLVVNTFFCCQMPIFAYIGFMMYGILFWGEKLIFMMMSCSPMLNLRVPIDFIIHLLPIYSISSILHTIHTYGNPKIFPTNSFFFFPNDQNFIVTFFIIIFSF